MRVGRDGKRPVRSARGRGAAEIAQLRDVAGPGPAGCPTFRRERTATSAGIWPFPAACSPTGAPTSSIWPSGDTTASTTGPVAVEGKGDFPPRDAVYNTAATFELHYRYADGVTLTVSAGRGDLDPTQRHAGPVVGRTPNPGIRFEGDEGWIESHGWRGSLKANRRKMLDAVIDPAKVERVSPERNRRPHRRQGRRAPQFPRLRQVAKALLRPRRNRPSHDYHCRTSATSPCCWAGNCDGIRRPNDSSATRRPTRCSAANSASRGRSPTSTLGSGGTRNAPAGHVWPRGPCGCPRRAMLSAPTRRHAVCARRMRRGRRDQRRRGPAWRVRAFAGTSDRTRSDAPRRSPSRR